jgi:hypothetical protein
MTATLSSFGIKRDQEDFVLRVENDEGDVTKLTATYDQLDGIGELIDEQLAFGDVYPEPDASRVRSSERHRHRS